MEKVILNAEMRENTGKTNAKNLRKKEMIPAVIYKKGKDSVNLAVSDRELQEVLHTGAGENVIITLKIKGGKDKTCIIKELQKDPVKENVLHLDLKEISLTEKIKVKVPVHAHGEAEGVKKDGGVLEIIMWEVEIECLPTEIPGRIEIEVSPLKIGDTVYVKDLVVAPGIKVISDPELTVISVAAPSKEEVAEEVPSEEGAEPELIKKGKKEEEGEGEEGTGEAKEKPKKEEKAPKEEKKG